MIDRIEKDIKNHNLFTKKNNLLLAISGGADSVFLFFISFAKCRNTIGFNAN